MTKLHPRVEGVLELLHGDPSGEVASLRRTPRAVRGVAGVQNASATPAMVAWTPESKVAYHTTSATKT